MDVHQVSFEGIHLFRDAQVKSLSAEPLTIRILQMIGCGESNLPSLWALGGILMALVATVASIVTGARMVRLRLQEKRVEEEELCGSKLAIFAPGSCDADEGFEFDRCSSSLSTSSSSSSSSSPHVMRRRKSMEWGVTKRDLFVGRESDDWATSMEFWNRENPEKKSNCFWPDYSILEERRPVSALFRPLWESLCKTEEFSQFEGDEMLNMNFKHAWEMGKSKLRQWQQENLSCNSLFGKEDVVKFWDNLKGKALRTFYVHPGFSWAVDSGWMPGMASLGLDTSQDLLSFWDVDKATSGKRAQIQGLCMGSSNTIIIGGPDGLSGRTALKLWDTRMGRRPAAVKDSDLLVPRRIMGIKSGKLHKLYVKHDANSVSIHELRMLGGGPITTLTLEDPTPIQQPKASHHNLLCDSSSFVEMDHAQENTWWDDDAVIVSDEEEEEIVSEQDEYEDYNYDYCDSDSNHGGNKKSVVSWCLGAVRSISSSLAK